MLLESPGKINTYVEQTGCSEKIPDACHQSRRLSKFKPKAISSVELFVMILLQNLKDDTGFLPSCCPAQKRSLSLKGSKGSSSPAEP